MISFFCKELPGSPCKILNLRQDLKGKTIRSKACDFIQTMENAGYNCRSFYAGNQGSYNHIHLP